MGDCLTMLTRQVYDRNVKCNMYQWDCCPNENIIYVFRDNCECQNEYWKITLDLINKSKYAYHLHEYLYFCNDITPLNEIGYVILQFDNSQDFDYLLRNYLILALKFYNIEFQFDEIILQNIFNDLSEDKKNSFCPNKSHDWYGINEISQTGLYFQDPSDSAVDLIDFILDNTDYDGNIIPVYEGALDFDDVLYELELLNEKKKNEQKKLIAKYKRRETKYKKTGCKILLGLEAFNTISRNHNFSLIAIDTDDFYSIEYNMTQYLSEHNEDYYTVTKILNGKMHKEVMMDTLFFCDILKFKWAIVEYHSGFMEMI